MELALYEYHSRVLVSAVEVVYSTAVTDESSYGTILFSSS